MNMYQDTQTKSVSGEQDKLDTLILPLEKQLKIDSESKLCLSSLAKHFEVLEFNLGDLLETVSQNKNADNSAEKHQENQYFYLVCQGRIRLLGFNQKKQREVPTGLLTEGNTFGGEHLFDQDYLSYKAIAAAKTVRVARIPLQKLQPELAPQLKEHWRVETQNRQSLIFFKTSTALQALSSQKLEQILPYFEKRQIPAGTSLAEMDTSFWLCRGEIAPQSLDTGSFVGYPDPIPDDWVAQSNLFIYYLPKQHWETVCRIIPAFANLYADNSDRSESNNNQTKTIVITPRDSSAIADTQAQISLPTETEPDSYSIDFPQPKQQNRAQFWRRYPYIQQQSSSDCGAACLGMISQYWGKRFTINYLRKLAGIGRTGISLKGFDQSSRKSGVSSSSRQS